MHCRAEYPRLALEERLIARVQMVLVHWTTQDVRCAKCKTVRVNDFMEYCGCSGVWVGMVDRKKVVRELGVVERVADGYGLKMLGAVVEGVLCKI